MIPTRRFVEPSGAIISPDQLYRYLLWRTWGEGARVAFCMLNPSTADAMADDPTIRRVVGYAKAWGYDGVDVVNLFSFRATDPIQLNGRSVEDLRGPDHARWYRPVLAEASLIIAAWGTKVPTHAHGTSLESALAHPEMTPRVRCLGKNKDGSPKHPLYRPLDQQLEFWP